MSGIGFQTGRDPTKLMQGPTGETRSEPVQVRCIQCGLAFTLSAKEDQFCSGRCKRQSLGVRKKSSILMVAVGLCYLTVKEPLFEPWLLTLLATSTAISVGLVLHRATR
jgi:hypothetical protein